MGSYHNYVDVFFCRQLSYFFIFDATSWIRFIRTWKTSLILFWLIITLQRLHEKRWQSFCRLYLWRKENVWWLILYLAKSRITIITMAWHKINQIILIKSKKVQTTILSTYVVPLPRILIPLLWTPMRLQSVHNSGHIFAEYYCMNVLEQL